MRIFRLFGVSLIIPLISLALCVSGSDSSQKPKRNLGKSLQQNATSSKNLPQTPSLISTSFGNSTNVKVEAEARTLIYDHTYFGLSHWFWTAVVYGIVSLVVVAGSVAVAVVALLLLPLVGGAGAAGGLGSAFLPFIPWLIYKYWDWWWGKKDVKNVGWGKAEEVHKPVTKIHIQIRRKDKPKPKEEESEEEDEGHGWGQYPVNQPWMPPHPITFDKQDMKAQKKSQKYAKKAQKYAYKASKYASKAAAAKMQIKHQQPFYPPQLQNFGWGDKK